MRSVAQTRQKAKGSPKSRKNNGSEGPEVMLTWEVLRSIYPAHTYHLEDNPAYRDIVVTRNVIAKVNLVRGCLVSVDLGLVDRQAWVRPCTPSKA